VSTALQDLVPASLITYIITSGGTVAPAQAARLAAEAYGESH
jgi:translation initiation factor 2B subunit (eIF-2B alpha/beta/delta family)